MYEDLDFDFDGLEHSKDFQFEEFVTDNEVKFDLPPFNSFGASCVTNAGQYEISGQCEISGQI